MSSIGAVRRLTTSIREDGIRGSAQKMIRIVREPLFDLRHGTDTGGTIDPSLLDLSGPNAEYAVEYVPTGYHDLHQLFRTLDLPTDGAFVDFGSGKGRVLLMASRLGFSRVVGIELSAALCAVARRNAARFGDSTSKRIQILNEDADCYEFRGDEVVVFLFNPFDEPVMKSVIQNLRESLRRTPRQVWVVYYHARCRNLLDADDLFLKAAEHPMRHHTALVYTNDAAESRVS